MRSVQFQSLFFYIGNKNILKKERCHLNIQEVYIKDKVQIKCIKLGSRHGKLGAMSMSYTYSTRIRGILLENGCTSVPAVFFFFLNNRIRPGHGLDTSRTRPGHVS